MTGQQLYAQSISANLFLPWQVQSFTFDTLLSQYQIVNNSQPTSFVSSQNTVEFINVNDSGYRFKQLTSNSAQRGNFIFEQFNNGTIPGNVIITIQENTGNFIFSLQGGGAIQINNGTSVTPLEFFNASGTNYVGFQAGNPTSNIVWTLPITDSTGTQALVSNGAGVLSWSDILSGDAPADATYIIKTTNASLTNAQVLASLSTGLLKNTTSTGVLSIGVRGTDYYAPGYPTTIIDTTASATYNVGMGTSVLGSITTGVQNSAFGAGSLLQNTIGDYNSAFGFESLVDNTTGVQNSAFGVNSLLHNTIGNDNSAFGFQSLVDNTTGSQNSAFGAGTLASNETGSNNTVIGYSAAFNQSIYNNCCFLGAYADASVNNLTNAIAIGYNASVSASNCLILGNGCNVGIGVSNPSYLLHVNGAIYGTWEGVNIALAYGGTNATLTASNGGIVYSTSSALAILSGTSTANQILLSGASSAPIWSTATYPATTTTNQLLYSSSTNIISGLTTANNSVLLTNGSGVPAWQTLTSNVVTSITGTANQITASSSTGVVTLSMPANVIITTSVTAGNLEIITNTLQSNNTNGNIIITPNGTGIISLSSNVGIGTTTAHSALQFSSSINNRILTLFEGANNSYQYYGFGIQNNTLVYSVAAITNAHIFYCGASSTASQELMRITATGTTSNSGCIGINVGTTPSAGCHVIGGVQNVSGEDTCFRAQSSSNSAKIEFDCTGGSGRLYEIRSTNTGTLDIVDRTGSAERLVINTTGVGISSAPSYLLDVFGTARVEKLLGNANAPTATAGSAAGTSPTITIAGSELSGTISVTAGLTPSGTIIATFTLGIAMANSTYAVLFMAANSNAAALASMPWSTTSSTTQFTLNSAAVLVHTTVYVWNYHIIGC